MPPAWYVAWPLTPCSLPPDGWVLIWSLSLLILAAFPLCSNSKTTQCPIYANVGQHPETLGKKHMSKSPIFKDLWFLRRDWEVHSEVHSEKWMHSQLYCTHNYVQSSTCGLNVKCVPGALKIQRAELGDQPRVMEKQKSWPPKCEW